MEEQKCICPKCSSDNITFQREQSANIGAQQNKVVIMDAKEKKGCIYWLCIGWWWRPIRFICYGWFKDLFSRKKKGGINLGINKTINHTVAICQNCGNSWKVK